MRVLDLFSGIGGFAIAADYLGWSIAAFCDNDPECAALLRKRFSGIPLYADIKGFDYEQERATLGTIDVIVGGFPCQPFSVAGRRRGTADGRDLWPEMRRVIADVGPSWVVCENVANFLPMGFRRTKDDLENLGYAVQPFTIPACAVGAIHRRDRVWIVGHRAESPHSDVYGVRRQGGGQSAVPWQPGIQRFQGVGRVEDLRGRSDIPEPLVCRKNDGIPGGLDRLKLVGNAIVPEIALAIFEAIDQTVNSEAADD